MPMANFPAVPGGTTNYIEMYTENGTFMYVTGVQYIADYSGNTLLCYGTAPSIYDWNGSAWTGSGRGWGSPYPFVKYGSFYDNCKTDIANLAFNSVFGLGNYATNYPDLPTPMTNGYVFQFPTPSPTPTINNLHFYRRTRVPGAINGL